MKINFNRMLHELIENIQFRLGDSDFIFKPMNRDILHDALLCCKVYNDQLMDYVYVYEDDELYELMVQELNKLSDKDIIKINDTIRLNAEWD